MPNTPLRNLDFLHVVLEAVPSLLLVVDPQMRILHINSAASRKFSIDPRSAYLRRTGEVLHCLHAAEEPGGCGTTAVCGDCPVRQSVQEAAEGRELRRKSVKFDFFGAEGRTEVQLQITASPLSYEGDTHALIVIEDITELKKVEEALRLSETRLRNITAVIGQGLYVLDGDGCLASMNSEAEKLLGWTEAELLGRRVHEIIHCTQQTGEDGAADCLAFKAVSAGRTFREEDDTFTRKEGTVFPVAFVATPLVEKGQITGSVTLFQDITERKRAAEELGRLNKLLAHQATTDPLTGISNRLKLNESLAAEIRRARRYNLPLSLVMFDVDHFKAVNDAYGHHEGDRVLCELTALVANHMRAHDLFARWGGEEFMIMVTNSRLANAIQFAEKLRALVESHPFGDAGRITCSFGVAEYQGSEADDRFTQRVDDALYRAKARGRNCIEAADA